MYFYYGIKHSSLEEGNRSENINDGGAGSAGNIELTVTEHSIPQTPYPAQDRSIYEGQQLDAFGQPVFGSTNFGGTPNHNALQSQDRSMFIQQDSFPTWDD